MNGCNWRRTHALDNRRSAECRLVRHGVGEVDQAVFPAPAKLIEVRQSQTDHAGNRTLRSWVRRGEHRQARSFRHPDQDRPLPGAATGVVNEHLVVAGLLFGPQRRRTGREAFQVPLHVEADDEESSGGERFGHMRSKMYPSAVAAGHDHRCPASSAIQAERLELAPDAYRVGRLS